MAISYDQSQERSLSLSSDNLQFTATTSADALLYVAVAYTTGGGTLTGITVDGLVMTPVTALTSASGGLEFALQAFVGAGSGSHAIIISLNASTSVIIGKPMSFLGADTPDYFNFDTDSQTSVTSLDGAVTTVRDHCWVLIAGVSETVDLTAGTNCTLPGDAGSLNPFLGYFADVSPAGSKTIGVADSVSDTITIIVTEIRPPAATGQRFLLTPF